jgi:hypothetical protein
VGLQDRVSRMRIGASPAAADAVFDAALIACT